MSNPLVTRAMVAAVLAIIASAACAHTRTTRFDSAAYFPGRTPAESIRFYSAQPPSCPFEEVGRVTAESRPFVSWGRVVSAARKAAHELGGDAIIGVRDASRLSAATISTDGVIMSETESLSGIVIRFKDSACMT